MNTSGNTSETIASLNSARSIALNDPNYYPQILPAVVPITGPQADVELQRWGADFIAETFASPVLDSSLKQDLSLKVLDRLKEYLETPGADANVVKSAVQAASSIYPLVFRYTIKNPTDETTWQKVAGIKSNILRKMDSAPSGVRICCLKFVQRVVQTQTPGAITDPRRPDQNEISLALVPRDHPVIPPSNLEAEASGLLDRLMGILQEDTSDALLVTATLNSLGSLIHSRPSISNKIITQILNFNPTKLANGQITPKIKVVVKSMEKTTRALLQNCMKKNPENPLNTRIQQYIERMSRLRVESLDETNRKRSAPVEPTDGLDQHKRQRVDVALNTTTPPSLPNTIALPPSVSYAQLFSVTDNAQIGAFDVTNIPKDIVTRVIVPLLQAVDDSRLNDALNTVRKRYLDLQNARQQAIAAMTAAGVIRVPPPTDDDDEYEPDFQPIEDAEQLLNKLDNAEESATQQSPISLGQFKLPPPEPFTEPQLAETGKLTISRVFGMMSSTAPTSRQNAPKAGFNRLAAGSYDRNSWVTILTRLATRTTGGLDGVVKTESKSSLGPTFIASSIRDSLWHYVVEDFRRRIDVAISWLTEEWLNDNLMAQEGAAVKNYNTWSMKLLNGILPYLDAKDKNVLIRFLGEIPGLDENIISAVTGLADDPERVELVVTTLHYLILTRPPVRDLCIDAVENLWRHNEGAKSRTAKLLQRWRPALLQEEREAASRNLADAAPTGTNGVSTESSAIVKAEA